MPLEHLSLCIADAGARFPASHKLTATTRFSSYHQVRKTFIGALVTRLLIVHRRRHHAGFILSDTSKNHFYHPFWMVGHTGQERFQYLLL